MISKDESRLAESPVSAGKDNVVVGEKAAVKAGLEVATYFHGYMRVSDAKQLLRKRGDFVVHQSWESCGPLAVLTLRGADDFFSFSLRPNAAARYALRGSDAASSIPRLVSWLWGQAWPLDKGEKLERGVDRRAWELLPSHVDSPILERLGRGSFGTVTLHSIFVPPTVARVKAAIKRPDQFGSQIVFLEECVLSVAAQGDAVLRVLGVQLLQLPIRLVMEVSEWGDLKAAIEKKPSAAELLLWAMDNARGLAHLRAVRIIHRDVAARNFLLVSRPADGNRGTEKRSVISDFGLARSGLEWRTMEREKISPRWAAPELLAPTQLLSSPASDLWALGVVMWEMWVALGPDGLVPEPYAGLAEDLLCDQLGDGLRLDLPPTFPPKLADFTSRIWTLNPADRPHINDLVLLMQELQPKP